jgi:hypothetical protein
MSGIMLGPLIIGLIVSLLIGGFLTSKTGYYAPLMIIGSIGMSIGAGLITTFKVHSGHSVSIGYSAIWGLGSGIGFQGPMIAMQTLGKEDIPTASVIVSFAQTLGGVVFVSVGQNIFQSSMISRLEKAVGGIDASVIVAAGGDLDLKDRFSPEQLPAVLAAYNGALTNTFYAAVVLSCLTMIGALGMEWKSVKKGKTAAPAEHFELAV